MKCKALRCIYYNEGNGYTVASYVTEEALPEKVSTQKNSQYGMFTAVGNKLPTEDGLEVELNGTWKDGKFGIQYKVSSFQVVLPTNTEGIKAYLASDFIKGIGPVLAERIVDHYKEKTFEILEKDPGRLLEIKGITKKKLMEILEGYQSSETLRQLMVALSPFGVTPRKVTQI
ncbi:MAG: helix-hairpin-helix domain-containing protein [Blautia faecis]